MKNIKKIISFTLIITMMLTSAISAETTKSFTDLDKENRYYESVLKLVDKGVIEGYPDGTFRPDKEITRAELIKIVNQVFSYTQKDTNLNFTDVKLGEWYYEPVLIAQSAGYITGYQDKTFRPDKNITRQEFCKILSDINNFVELPYEKFPVDTIDEWATDYVKKVISNRIMTPDLDGKFRATQNATRGEVCEALAKFIQENNNQTPQTPSNQTQKTSEQGTTEQEQNNGKEVDETMSTVTRRLSTGVLPKLETEAQKEIVNDIIDNMNKYQDNNNHDYKSAASKTIEKFKSLSDTEKKQLQDEILKNNTTKDLLDLQEFFFPE